MKNVLFHILIILISCGIAACAGSNSSLGDPGAGDARTRSDCIFRPSIRGYTVLDESNLVIDGAGRRKYLVSLQRRAYGIDSAWQIGFDTMGSQICAGFSSVVFNGSMDNESIRIMSIRALEPEEHESILIDYGKKEPEVQQTPTPKEIEGADVEELDPTPDE